MINCRTKHSNKTENMLLNSGVIRSIWRRVVISPIPRGSDKEPYVPLNYRGISLFRACIKHAYSSVLNNRLANYLESLENVVDQQNGFRSSRSYTEHIFSFLR